jgi:membrane-associated phospholipid phosphatase
MAQNQDLTAEALERGAAPGRGYELGRKLSSIIHPIPLSVLTLFIVGAYSGPTTAAGLGWAALFTTLQIVPGTIFFTIRRRQGAYSDEDVSLRHQRNELYLFSFASALVVAAIGFLAGAPPAFKALLASGLLLNVLCWLINLFWKISVHAAGSAFAATVTTLFSTPLGALLWLCAVAVGWARVRTRNHTPAQVLAGWALAATCALVVFGAMGMPG